MMVGSTLQNPSLDMGARPRHGGGEAHASTGERTPLNYAEDQRQCVKAFREHAQHCQPCARAVARVASPEDFARRVFGSLCAAGQQFARACAAYVGMKLPPPADICDDG